jgi:hypothetical protein
MSAVVGVGAGLVLLTLARVVLLAIFFITISQLFSFALGQGLGRGADGRWSGSVPGWCCVR